MIRDPNKRYPGQPSLFAEPVMFGYRLIPVIDSEHPALYGCYITMNGAGIGMTRNGTREECECYGFDAMQRTTALFEADQRERARYDAARKVDA